MPASDYDKETQRPAGGAGTPVPGLPSVPISVRAAARRLSVPKGVKYLSTDQLTRLEESFRFLVAESGTDKTRHARTRVFLVFLLVRYSGLKLGEALSLRDTADLDLARARVRVKGLSRREVQLPKTVVDELATCLRSPLMRLDRGHVFRLDQGYVRRKFYERAEACGIPRKLSSPQAIRTSRAVELLRDGVPMPVVQKFLGQNTAGLAAKYVDCAHADAAELLGAYLQGELRSKTSARNLFFGRVSGVKRGEILSEVTLVTREGHRITSVITNASLENLGLKEGSPAVGMIKAPSVLLVKGGEAFVTSARNVLSGRVKAVRDDSIVAEVIVDLSSNVEVCALTTADSAARLGLRAGDEVSTVFDTSAVILSVAWVE
jgi:molybdate transport system regulatory protein